MFQFERELFGRRLLPANRSYRGILSLEGSGFYGNFGKFFGVGSQDHFRKSRADERVSSLGWDLGEIPLNTLRRHCR